MLNTNDLFCFEVGGAVYKVTATWQTGCNIQNVATGSIDSLRFGSELRVYVLRPINL